MRKSTSRNHHDRTHCEQNEYTLITVTHPVVIIILYQFLWWLFVACGSSPTHICVSGHFCCVSNYIKYTIKSKYAVIWWWFLRKTCRRFIVSFEVSQMQRNWTTVNLSPFPFSWRGIYSNSAQMCNAIKNKTVDEYSRCKIEFITRACVAPTPLLVFMTISRLHTFLIFLCLLHSET